MIDSLSSLATNGEYAIEDISGYREILVVVETNVETSYHYIPGDMFEALDGSTGTKRLFVGAVQSDNTRWNIIAHFPTHTSMKVDAVQAINWSLVSFKIYGR